MLKTKEPNYWNKQEKVKLLKACRVKEFGAEEAEAYKAGDVVNVSGAAKYELLSRGLAEPLKAETKK